MRHGLLFHLRVIQPRYVALFDESLLVYSTHVLSTDFTVFFKPEAG
jgi:hypothetical protein